MLNSIHLSARRRADHDLAFAMLQLSNEMIGFGMVAGAGVAIWTSEDGFDVQMIATAMSPCLGDDMQYYAAIRDVWDSFTCGAEKWSVGSYPNCIYKDYTYTNKPSSGKYELMYDPVLQSPVLRCEATHGVFPLYKCELAIESYQRLHCWARQYMSLWNLWYESSEYEIWADGQLRRLDGYLSKEGKSLAEVISRSIKCHVEYKIGS